MKKTLILTMLSLLAAFSCISAYAAGGIELQITNKTGKQIEEIMIIDTEANKTKIEPVNLINNSEATIKIKKRVNYNIILIDVNQHHYGILNRHWNRNKNHVKISHFDFIHQSISDTFKRIIGR